MTVFLCAQLAEVDDLILTSPQVETAKAQAEEWPVGETIVLEKAAPLIKDPRRPGLRPAGLPTHTNTVNFAFGIPKCCNIRFTIVFPFQSQVLSKFLIGLLMKSGCGKMCSHLRHPQCHPR